MKTILLVIYNFIRLNIIKVGVRQLLFERIQMIGWNSRLLIHKKSLVEFGRQIVSDGRFVIITGENSRLLIGDNVYFNEDCMISCKGEINIGNNCKFGPNVKIFDNNHCFSAENGVSNDHTFGRVEIGKGSWIGANCVILKGAKIGKNCVIGAGCVIDKEIPEASIVTQNRNNVIRKIER